MIVVNTEEEAIEALEAVLAWAQEAPESGFHGEATGITFQRGKIVASRVLPELTVGVSTYLSAAEAQEKAANMERAYRNWVRLTGRQP